MNISRTFTSILLAMLFSVGLVSVSAQAQSDPYQDRRGQFYGPGNRLDTLTDRLVQLARAQADDAFNEFDRRYTDVRYSNQSNVDRLYRAQAFSSNAELFQRLTRSRRSERDLQPSLAYLMNQSVAGTRSNEIRATLQEIQRTLRGGPWGGNGGNTGQTGVLRWSGRVDSEVLVYIRSGSVRTETRSGIPTSGERYNFTSALPLRPMVVSLNRLEGRGSVELIQQPSASNRYTAVVRIRDDNSGAGDYDFELSW